MADFDPEELADSEGDDDDDNDGYDPALPGP